MTSLFLWWGATWHLLAVSTSVTMFRKTSPAGFGKTAPSKTSSKILEKNVNKYIIFHIKDIHWWFSLVKNEQCTNYIFYEPCKAHHDTQSKHHYREKPRYGLILRRHKHVSWIVLFSFLYSFSMPLNIFSVHSKIIQQI